MAHPVDPSGASTSSPLWGCAILAVMMHAAILALGSRTSSDALSAEGESLEVALVASIDPGPTQAQPGQPADQPVEKPPEKQFPEEPEKKEETPPPQQDPPLPTPQKPAEIEEPTPPKPPERKLPPAPPARKALPARSGPTGGPAPSGPQGAVQGTSGPPGMRPFFSYPPRPSYPSESRAAKEEGTVVIRMVVNADGRPTQVSVAKSSGFPRLDRSAQEAAWRCRIRNAAPGKEVDASIVFRLQD